MSHWMFNCKKVSRRVSESMDRNLAPHHRLFIRIHLLMCKYCARFRKQLLFLKETARFIEGPPDDLETSTLLSSEARNRMKQMLRTQSD